MKKKLQVAFDITDLDRAVTIASQIEQFVDIIEVGTPLCLCHGMNALRRLKEICSTKFLTADIRIARAGAKLANIAFDAGANAITAVGEAPLNTIQAAYDVASKRGGILQVEPEKTIEQNVLNWLYKIGIRQLILHNSAEVEHSKSSFSNMDIERMNQLADQGFELSITGGITLDSISKFSDVPVDTFIVGRSIVDSSEPVSEAGKFREAIDNIHA